MADKTQKNNNYFAELDRANILHLRELLAELPDYCRTYLRGIEPRTQSRTRIAYAYDLRVFFQYLMRENPLAARYGTAKEIPLSLLEKLRATDLEEYMEYLKYRPTEQGEGKLNQETGIKRKLSSLRSFYKYLYQKEMIESNPADRVLLPKLHEKEIIRLDVDEIAELLDQIESGEKLSERQRRYHEKTKLRDLALITLLLGTGIRVSECVGLNLNDVDFKNDGIRVCAERRKTGQKICACRSTPQAYHTA